MATEKTELTDLLAYGVDIKNRKIYFGIALDYAEDDPSEFTNTSVEYAVRALHRMAIDAPDKPIEIHMSSYGGYVDAMFRLHDEILASPCQIKFYGGGVIMSAASFIMATCDERYLHPNTTVMLHELSNGDEGRHHQMKINMIQSELTQNKLNEIYAANSRMPKEFWEEICEKDVYISASEAVSFGLADKIIEPKKRGNLRRMRQANLKKEVDEKEMKDLVASVYKRLNKKKVPRIVMNEFEKEPADPTVVVAKTEDRSDGVELKPGASEA